MSESEGKSAEYVAGFVAGIRWAKKELGQPVEPWHGKSRSQGDVISQ